MRQRKIYLEKNRDVKSVNKQSFVNINLSTKSKLLPYNDISDVLNLNNLYINERNNCSKYRIILNVNPICTNVLYNARTEVVRHEGGDNAELLIGTDKLSGLTLSDIKLKDNKYVPASGSTINSANINTFIDFKLTGTYESGDSGIIKKCNFILSPEELNVPSKGTQESDITEINSAITISAKVDDIESNPESIKLKQEANVLTVYTEREESGIATSGGTISGNTEYYLYIEHGSISDISNSGETLTNAVSGYSFTPFSSYTMSEDESMLTIISAYTSTAIISAKTSSYDSGMTITSSWTVTNRDEEIEVVDYPEWVSNVTVGRNGKIIVGLNEEFEDRTGNVIYQIASSVGTNNHTTGYTSLQQNMRPIEINRIEVRNIVLPSSASTAFPDRIYNVPAKGGTLAYNTRGVSYEVIAYYNNGTSGDVTTRATVSGSQSVASKGRVISNITTPATLRITAEYGGKTANSAATIYQQENHLTTSSAYTETIDQKISHYGTPVTSYTNTYVYIPSCVKTNVSGSEPYYSTNNIFEVPYNNGTYIYRANDGETTDSVKTYKDTSGTTQVYETWSGITVYHSAWTSTATAQTRTWQTISGDTRDEEWNNREQLSTPIVGGGYDTNIFGTVTVNSVGLRENNGFSDKEGSITYRHSSTITGTVTFKQGQRPHSLSFNFDNGGHTYSGSTGRIIAYGKVNAENIVWQYSGDTGTEWLTMRPLTGISGTTSVVLDANANTSIDPRVGRFYVVCRDEPSIYDWGEIYQEGAVRTIRIQPTNANTIWNVEIAGTNTPGGSGSFRISPVDSTVGSGQIIGQGIYEVGNSVAWQVSGYIEIKTNNMQAHTVRLKYADTANQSYQVEGSSGTDLSDLNGFVDSQNLPEFNFSIPAGTTDITINIGTSNPNLIFDF